MDNSFANFVVNNLRAIGAPEHSIYEDILSNAILSAPPPFSRNWFGRRYFELARKPDWFANSLVSNAALEGYGARQIWKFSNKIDDDLIASDVRMHSLDESRHSTLFVSMLKLVFPGATLDGATDKQLDNLQPKFSTRNHPAIEKCSFDEQYSGEFLLNELIQVHITEIRALVLQYLLRPTLQAYCIDSSREQLDRCTSLLIRDESRHIEYTAQIFESAARSCKNTREFLFDAFESRLREFNELTMIELEREKVAI